MSNLTEQKALRIDDFDSRPRITLMDDEDILDYEDFEDSFVPMGVVPDATHSGRSHDSGAGNIGKCFRE